MASRDGKWAALLGAVERLRVAVEETERLARLSPTVPPAIAATLDVIHRRLVMDLRPLVLGELKDLAGCNDGRAAARTLMQILEANPALMSSFVQGAPAPDRREPPGH